MTCKGCKAVKGDRHPGDIVDFTGCRRQCLSAKK